MKVGDMVRIDSDDPIVWSEAEGQIGIIVAMAKRLYVPAVKVMVVGEVAEFDLNEVKPV